MAARTQRCRVLTIEKHLTSLPIDRTKYMKFSLTAFEELLTSVAANDPSYKDSPGEVSLRVWVRSWTTHGVLWLHSKGLFPPTAFINTTGFGGLTSLSGSAMPYRHDDIALSLSAFDLRYRPKTRRLENAMYTVKSNEHTNSVQTATSSTILVLAPVMMARESPSILLL